MLSIIIKILYIVAILTIAISLHELSHWFYYYRKFGFKFNIQWWYDSFVSFGFRSFFPKVSNESEKLNLLFAITTGMVFIGFLVAFQTYFIITLPLYFAGCRKDINRLIELIEEEVRG